MFLCAIDIVDRIADGMMQSIPYARLAEHFCKTVGQILGAANTEMQTVLAIADLFSHTANIRADNRTAMVQCLLNDDG